MEDVGIRREGGGELDKVGLMGVRDDGGESAD